MSSFTDKIKGKFNEAIGKSKQGVGEATDDRRLEDEGHIQEAEGDGQQMKGKVKENIKDTVDRF